MSLAVKTLSFLSIKPYLWFENGVHCSRSHLAVIVFSLGSYRKRVEVDPDRRTVSVGKRFLWIFNSVSRYSFDDVVRISYDCDTIPTAFDYFYEASDEFDMFRVSLELKSREVIRLWTFYGEGAVTTGWAGTLMGDSAVDLAGDQADASQGYANVLCAMMDKTLS